MSFQVDGTSNATEWEDFTPIIYFQAPDESEVGVAVRESKVYIAFEGTDVDVPPDIWANLNAFFTDFELLEGQVHQGYYNKVFGTWLYTSLAWVVDYVFLVYGEGMDQLIITGHSQGGALATLFGVYVALEWPDRVVSVYNLGTPRVGDEVFKQAVRRDVPNLAIFRLVFEEDAVPRLPPRMMGYRHPGHLLHIQGTGETKAYWQQTGDEGNEYGGVPGSAWDVNYLDILDPLDPVNDHSDSDYLAALQLAAADSSLWPSAFEEPERYCCLWFFWCIRHCYT